MEPSFSRRTMLSILAATAAATHPVRAQETGSGPLVGFVLGLADDAEARARIRAFEQGLKEHGWIPGQNIRIIYRFAADSSERIRSLAKELVGLAPDILVGHSSPVVGELCRTTRSIPIVFVVVADPVGSGFVASIPRPGGNATGFTNLAPTITGKLLTILKQLRPDLARVALLYSPDASINSGELFLRPLEQAGLGFGIEVIAAPGRHASDIEHTLSQLGRKAGSGLIVMPDNFTTVHRNQIVAAANRERIPAVYPYKFFADAGGLLSYGVDVRDLFRRAPEYVSRILRGEKPGELPVQAPTKFELAINLRTAKALGISVPRVLLAQAEALIE